MKAHWMIALLPFALMGGGCHGGFGGDGTGKTAAAFRSEPVAAPGPVQWQRFFSDGPLKALIDRALENNHDLKMAMARVDAARARVNAAKGAMRPVVEGKIEGVRGRSGRYIDDDYSETGRNLFAGVQASWEIDLWGKLRSEKGAALNRLLASGEAQRLVRTTVIAEVAAAYYELKSLDTTLVVLNRTEKLQEEAIESVKAQVEAGRETRLAVQQFEAQLRNIQALKIEAEREIAENEAALSMLCGSGVEKAVRSSGSIEQAKLPQLAVRVPSPYVENRPDVREAQYELEAARGDVRAAKAAFYPNVTIDGMLGLQAFRAGKLPDSRSTAHSAGGSLVAPLLNRNALKAEFAEAGAAELEALHAYRQALLTGYVEVHNQVASGRLLERLGQRKAEESEFLNAAVSTSTDLFQSGRANYLEVLTARQSALEAELERIDIRKRRFQTSVNLYKALGGG